MNPYRVSPVKPPEPDTRIASSFERVVIGTALVLGGTRVVVSLLLARFHDAELKLAVFLLAVGGWCSARHIWRHARMWRRRTRDLHARNARSSDAGRRAKRTTCKRWPLALSQRCITAHPVHSTPRDEYALSYSGRTSARRCRERATGS